MQAGASAEPGPDLVESELNDKLLGWVLLVVALLLMMGAGMMWLIPGVLSVLDSSDIRDWWQTSASFLAIGAILVVLALTSLITGLLLIGRRRWTVNPVVFAAITGTCAVLTLTMGELVSSIVILGCAGALLMFLRRRSSRTATHT